MTQCRLSIAIAILAFASTPLRAGATASGWDHLSSDTPQEIQVDARGRVWANFHQACVRLLETPPSVGGMRATPANTRWRDFVPPPGHATVGFAITPTDTLYVACTDISGGPSTVFRRAVADGARWEELPIPGPYGLMESMAVDVAGTVWLGGERGEVFRLQGRRWHKEVLPRPLHCEDLFPTSNGDIWARTQSRGKVGIVMRRDGVWRTIVAEDGIRGGTRLLYADAGGAVVIAADGLRRASADEPGTSRPWFDLKAEFTAVESSRSAWAVRGGHLLHLVDGAVEDHGETSLLPILVVWRGKWLWVATESGLWRLVDPDARETIDWPLKMVPDRMSDMRLGAPAIYGLGILCLRGDPHLYMARHTTVDAVVPLGTRDRMAGWVATSEALGLEAIDESLRWEESYEMAVAAGDLDADGCEDIVLATMHDGCRMLRNMHDRRLVHWTEESGLQVWREDVAEDIDLLDADNDGDLDIFSCNLQGQDRLGLNDGSAHFVDVLPKSGIQSPFGSTSGICRDLDGDGDTDIVVSTCGAGLFIHENLGPVAGVPCFRSKAMFADIPNPESATGLSAENFTGVEAVDFDRDGLLDLFVGGRSQSTKFLRNRGGMIFEPDQSVFVDGAPAPKVAGVTAMDPDADGDWDLALTGNGGTRFLENTAGRLKLTTAASSGLQFGPNRYSTGSVLVDIDDDLDLDYIEAFVDAAPAFYYNNNSRPALLVTVRGPGENSSAVGARVEIWHAGSRRPAAATQEIPGGSGYASHATKVLAFGGLSPDSLYDVSVRLPGGSTALHAGAPARGHIVVDMQKSWLKRAYSFRARIHAAWGDRWTRVFIILVVASTAVLAAFGIIQQRRMRVSYPWSGVAAMPVAAWGLRQFWPLDPGPSPVMLATLGSLAIGILAVGLSRPRVPAPTTTMLADFARSLKVFEHNNTPRRIIDRIRLVRSNPPTRDQDWQAVAPLLREDIALFGVVVAPELAFVVEGARAAGLDHGTGARLLRKMRSLQSQLLATDASAWSDAKPLAQIDALLATTDTFREWTSMLRAAVDRRLATRLSPYLERYAASRMKLHPTSITCSPPTATVRLPEAEFSRILDILLENAVRACAGRRVEFEITGTLSPTGRLKLAVRDDGPGVPPDIRARIFDAGVTGSRGGTGYGLYAARRIIEHFGGQIVLVESRAGACFEIELGTIRDPEA